MNSIITELITRFPVLEGQKENIEKACGMMIACYEARGKVLACGNGGSAADADHIVGELMKGFLKKRPLPQTEKQKFKEAGDETGIAEHLQVGLPAISLCAQGGLMTAFLNDCTPEDVFAQQVYGYARNSGDLLIGLSTSGNSKNVVNAVIAARAAGIPSLAITGAKESRLSALATLCIRLPETETFKIQELTLPVYHALCAVTEQHFFAE